MLRLTLGTRGSALAQAQSRTVIGALERDGHEVTVRVIHTSADRGLDHPLPEVGRKGVLTGELDRALLDGEIDVAVHSVKDLPTGLSPGLALAAVTERERPEDVLVVAGSTQTGLTSLPRGARLGTSSLHRRALALAFRSDIEVVPIRGNVDTRLRTLDEGRVDAVLLAAAELRRLGLSARAAQVLDPTLWVPAPGQGALGVVTREDDADTRDALNELEHHATRAAVTYERAVLEALGGGYRLPLGALGLPYDGGIRGRAIVLSPEGRHLIRADRTGRLEDPAALGHAVADTLIARGARSLLTVTAG
jgi:hydroxymethylbilane synthase